MRDVSADEITDGALLRALLLVAAPLLVQNGVQVLQQVVDIFFLGRFGEAAVAAVGFATPVRALIAAGVLFLPLVGTQIVVSQYAGAGNAGRAARTAPLGVAVAAGVLAVVGVFQWLVPGPLATLLAPELSGTALGFARDYLRILAYGYPALGALYLFEAGFNGVGRSGVSFVATTLQYALVRLPIAAVGVLALGYGVGAVFWAVTLSNVLAAVALGLYYRRAVAGGMFRDAATRRIDPG